MDQNNNNKDSVERQPFAFESDGETDISTPYYDHETDDKIKMKKKRRHHPVLAFVAAIVVSFILGGVGMYFAYNFGVVDAAERVLRDVGLLPGYSGNTKPDVGQKPQTNTNDDDIVTELPSIEPSADTDTETKPKPPFKPVENPPEIVLSGTTESEAIEVADIAELLGPSTVAVVAHASAKEEDGYNLGSGTIFTSDGYIITNTHVVEGAYSIEVVLDGGEYVAAELIACDSTADIAILKVYRKDLKPVDFGSSKNLRVGDTVVAIGCPASLELQGTTTVGIISAQRRELTMDNAGNKMSLIQTDASINPGNSGGPLINIYGQVVGINTAKLSAFTYEGIGFAIPSDDLVKIIADLFEYGYVRGYPSIGIIAGGVPAGKYGNNPAGVYVSSVEKNSGAYEKLFVGDVILKVNGEEVLSVADVNLIKNDFAVGDKLTLTVWRDGETTDIDVELVDKGELAG